MSGLPEIGDEMCASRVNPTCVDRSSLWRSRIGGAPLRAAPRPGHAIASDALVVLFTFQTAHLVPAAHVCARGLQLCFTHPESRGGRSADPPPVHPHVASGYPRLLQKLSFPLLRPPQATSTILTIHQLELG